MKIAVILPAAGVGKRFAPANATQTSKIELDLEGRAVFLRAVDAFRGRRDVGQIIVAVNPQTIDEFRFKWADQCAFAGVSIVPGGVKERWETVLKALEHVEDDITHVAIHDAARPLVSKALIDRIFEAAQRFDAVIPGVPVSNTLKRVTTLDEDQDTKADPLAAILGDAAKPRVIVQRVTDTIDRNSLVEIQTPQVFALPLLRKAYARVHTLPGAGATDDAMLVESLGEPVRVVEGEATNLKLTRPDDLKLIRALVAQSKSQDAATLAKKRLFGDDDE